MKMVGCTRIPLIFLTAMTSVEDERKGLELGAADYVTKPYAAFVPIPPWHKYPPL